MYTERVCCRSGKVALELVGEVLNLIYHIQGAGETSFTGIRLDILVDIIRGLFFLALDYRPPDYAYLASESPQTFHQALLLIASLARVAPKSVLHNIMPVFTFMGSNVFHRDDNYSFRVVQKVGAL
jgi:U3 small nucleolar RNA-associated protein 10